jgi:hypothetical protein
MHVAEDRDGKKLETLSYTKAQGRLAANEEIRRRTGIPQKLLSLSDNGQERFLDEPMAVGVERFCNGEAM